MNRDKFIKDFLSYYPMDTVALITPKISTDRKIMDFVYVIIILDGREFYLRFTFDKDGTECEVVIEEYREHDLNLIIAHYPIEDTAINPQLDKTSSTIIQRVNKAYQIN
jgi:hypothetical protein